MWSSLPTELLTFIFSFLPPDTLARARAVCQQWNFCAQQHHLLLLSSTSHPHHLHHPPWLLAMPAQNCRHFCYAYNPCLRRWYNISLGFIPNALRLAVAAVGDGLLLVKPSLSIPSPLALCNPFTQHYMLLPPFLCKRCNPSIGVVSTPAGGYRIYVAGGSSNCTAYVSTMEMFDSEVGTWQITGKMPEKYAARMILWSTSGSVHHNGVLYWITSAKVYNVIGVDVGAQSPVWFEVGVPCADQLEFATLVVTRGGKGLGLVGGLAGGEVCLWELEGRDTWVLVDNLPGEAVTRLLGREGKLGSVKCVGGGGLVYLFKDFRCGMLVWKAQIGSCRRDWYWVKRCLSGGDGSLPSFPVKGVVLWPSLSPIPALEK